MLRTSLAIIAMLLFVGTAYAANATSEDQAIERDQNTQPSSPDQSLQNQSQPSDQMGPAEKGQMNEDSNTINN